jgi:hypothetical protein|tara:strand:- start:4712 stop:4882 length:171 start_codon:yes stop_codon:yes gene_type:complete
VIRVSQVWAFQVERNARRETFGDARRFVWKKTVKTHPVWNLPTRRRRDAWMRFYPG